jgi:hypothetical protein
MPAPDPFSRTCEGKPVVWIRCADVSQLALYSLKKRSVKRKGNWISKKNLVYDPRHGEYTKYGNWYKEPYFYERAVLLDPEEPQGWSNAQTEKGIHYLSTLSKTSTVSAKPTTETSPVESDDEDEVITIK